MSQSILWDYTKILVCLLLYMYIIMSSVPYFKFTLNLSFFSKLELRFGTAVPGIRKFGKGFGYRYRTLLPKNWLNFKLTVQGMSNFFSTAGYKISFCSVAAAQEYDDRLQLLRVWRDRADCGTEDANDSHVQQGDVRYSCSSCGKYFFVSFNFHDIIYNHLLWMNAVNYVNYEI